MDLSLKGKVALVAASSRGLGRAVAEELAAEGAKLIICSRREGTINQTAREIAATTGVDILAPAVGNVHGMLRSIVQGKTRSVST